MTIEEAKRLTEDVRTRYHSSFSASDKRTIKILYENVLGKVFRVTSCQRCYHDAVIEIALYLRKHDKMALSKNYIMRNGFIIKSPLFRGGQMFTNANLTDEVAAEYLAQFPNMAKMFAKLPEKPVSVASDGTKPDEMGKTPQAKKKAKRTKNKKE